MDNTISIFVSYAHEDDNLRKELYNHLSQLKWQGSITTWHNQDIGPGTNWEHEIKKHLNTTDIILLLISSDFMASEYCTSVEMRQAIEKHERGEVRVIPIILRSVYWKNAPFGVLQVLPRGGKPIHSTNKREQDEAFTEVVTRISEIVEDFLKIKRQKNMSTLYHNSLLNPSSLSLPNPQAQMSFEASQKENARGQGQNETTVLGQDLGDSIRMSQPQSKPLIPFLTHIRALQFNRPSLILSIIAIIVLIASLFSLLIRPPQISPFNTNISHNNTQSSGQHPYPTQSSIPASNTLQTPEQSSSPTQDTIPTSTNSPKTFYQADWSNGMLNGWESNDPNWQVDSSHHLIDYNSNFATNEDSDITIPLQSLPTNYDIYTQITLPDTSFYYYGGYFGIFVGSSSQQSVDGYTCRFTSNNGLIDTSLVAPGSTPTATTSIQQTPTEFTITLKVRGNEIEASDGSTSHICEGNMNNPGKYIGITIHKATIDVDVFKIIEGN